MMLSRPPPTLRCTSTHTCLLWCRYVEQQDIHSAGNTVREALVFSARLRLEESIKMPQVQQIVEDTL